MKKLSIILRVISALLAVLIFACALPAVTASGKTTLKSSNKIYFSNDNNWSAVYAYSYGDYSESFGTWPGTPCTDEGDGVWSIEMSHTPEFIIFNDYNGNQTNNMSYDGTGKIAVLTGEIEYNDFDDPRYVAVWKDYYETPISTDPAYTEPDYPDDFIGDTITVYFENTYGWSTVYWHAWSEEGPTNSAWPGDPMEYVGGNVYKAIIDASSVGIVFNDGSQYGAMTDNLSVAGDNMIYRNGGWFEYYKNNKLSSFYATNPNGQFGKYATITIDGRLKDWDSSMLIAQGTANDDPRVYRPNSMYEIGVDLYALYGAYDDDNLYLMWEMTNVQDVVAPWETYPLSQGVLWQTQEFPFFIVIDTGDDDTTVGNGGALSTGGTIWNSGMTFENSFNKLISINTKGSNGPWVFGGDSTGLNSKAILDASTSNIDMYYGLGILSDNVYGIDKAYGSYNNRVPGDVSNEAADWVDFNNLGHKSSTMDFFYEMSIPLSELGITRNDILEKGVGVMVIGTSGKSALDCLPGDLCMTDRADLDDSAGSQENNSFEKSDEDYITASFARIGKSGGEETTPVATEPSADGYIYLKTSWSSANCHSWNVVGSATEWPGTPMEYIGDGVYRIQLPEGHNMVVFNGDGQQTGDIEVFGTGMIWDYKWYEYNTDSVVTEPTEVSTTAAPVVTDVPVVTEATEAPQTSQTMTVEPVYTVPVITLPTELEPVETTVPSTPKVTEAETQVTIVAPEKYVLGDVNGDGEIDVNDAVKIMKLLAKFEELSDNELQAADFDLNDRVNIKDVTAIQKYLAFEREIEPNILPVYAQGVVVDGKAYDVQAGDKITYRCILDAPDRIECIQGYVEYDPEKLGIISTDAYTRFPNIYGVVAAEREGMFVFNAADISGGIDFMANKVLVELQFEVLDNSGAEIVTYIEEMTGFFSDAYVADGWFYSSDVVLLYEVNIDRAEVPFSTAAQPVTTIPRQTETATSEITVPDIVVTIPVTTVILTEATETDPTETVSEETTTASTQGPTEVLTDATEVTTEAPTEPSEAETETTLVTEPSEAETTSDVLTSTLTDPTKVSETTATLETNPAFDTGDVNKDNKVNIKDVTTIQKFLAKIIDFDDVQKILADYNGDGLLNIKDATTIQKKLANLI